MDVSGTGTAAAAEGTVLWGATGNSGSIVRREMAGIRTASSRYYSAMRPRAGRSCWTHRSWVLSLRQWQRSNRASGPDYLTGLIEEPEGRLPAPVEAQLAAL